MPRPPLIVDAFGATLVADDSEDKLRALCVVAFGAIKGIAKQGGVTFFVEDPAQLAQYREQVAEKIIKLVGAEMVERSYGIKLQVTTQPHPRVVQDEAKGVQ